MFIVLCVGESKAIRYSLRGGVCNTAWHIITVIVVAFLTQENKASKMQSTINQLTL